MNIGLPSDYTAVDRSVFTHVCDAVDWTRERCDYIVYRNKWNNIRFGYEAEDGKCYVSPAVMEWLKTNPLPSS